MNRKQRARKKFRAQEHTIWLAKRKREATEKGTLEANGYVPDGRGGWRRRHRGVHPS